MYNCNFLLHVDHRTTLYQLNEELMVVIIIVVVVVVVINEKNQSRKNE